jgi:RNA polymerase sigma-70 factor (ECF subfamily)
MDQGAPLPIDPQSWDDLGSHTPWLIERLRCAGHEATEAEDLAQEALLRGAQRQAAGEVLTSPQGWLLVVARNLGRDLHRRRERMALESLEVLGHEPCVAEGPEPPAQALPLESLHRAFLELAPRDQLVLTAWTLHEGAAHRVAEDLGVKRELVKVRLFRARRRLRRALAAERIEA